MQKTWISFISILKLYSNKVGLEHYSTTLSVELIQDHGWINFQTWQDLCGILTEIIKGFRQRLDTTTVGRNLGYSKIVCKISFSQITTTTISLLSSKVKVREWLLISLMRNFKILTGKLLKTINEMKNILSKNILPTLFISYFCL